MHFAFFHLATYHISNHWSILLHRTPLYECIRIYLPAPCQGTCRFSVYHVYKKILQQIILNSYYFTGALFSYGCNMAAKQASLKQAAFISCLQDWGFTGLVDIGYVRLQEINREAWHLDDFEPPHLSMLFHLFKYSVMSFRSILKFSLFWSVKFLLSFFLGVTSFTSLL